MRASVAFAMEWLPQYRVPFFDGLRERLWADEVEVRLVHGRPPPSRVQRHDAARVSWAKAIPNKVATVRGVELVWQPVWREVRDADLIVVQQESGLLFNYLALAGRRLGGPPVALWGHGENPNPLTMHTAGENLKAKFTPRADWWFAYTERSAEVFRLLGCDPERTTVVQNTIAPALPNSAPWDEPALDSGRRNARTVELVLGVHPTLAFEISQRTRNVGWMCSALDENKRVGFLVEVLDATRRRVNDFEFVVIGAGPEAYKVRDAAESRPWLHYVGPVFGADKAAYAEIARVMIHPGLVGLHVIDSFHAGTPIVVENLGYHSHEISYLTRSNSALIHSPASADTYAGVAEAVLLCSGGALVDGCRDSAERYSMAAMVENFAVGILACLESQ